MSKRDQQELARATRNQAVDIEVMARALPPDALRETNLARALIDAENDRSGGTLALAALLSVMGAEQVEFVRDDDGALWPFVKGEPCWRGPLRRSESGLIQMARFYPNEERLEWGVPFEEKE